MAQLKDQGFDGDAKKQVVLSMAKIAPFYSCGGVFQWINALTSPTPGVMVSENSVNEYTKSQFMHGPPASIRDNIGVAVPVDDSFDPMNHKGDLTVCTPIEYLHAALLACCKDIDRTAPDATMRDWRKCFKSIKIEFYLIPTGMVGLLAFHLREHLVAGGQAAAWSVLQRVQMVIRERTLLESKLGCTPTVAQLSAHFMEAITFAS